MKTAIRRRLRPGHRRELYPEPPAARKGASWVFVLRFTHPRHMVQLTREGLIYKVTATAAMKIASVCWPMSWRTWLMSHL